MLQNLSKYIFFTLLISFFTVIYFYITKKTPINSNFLYLFWILILPFFDKIIDFIKNDLKKIFFLDSRISFLIALYLLCYTVLFIFVEDKKIAEKLSIYAYYFLIIWVWLEIIENLFFNKTENEK
jgi:hypothetical protein